MTTQAKSNRRYKVLCRLAAEAHRREDYRLSADKDLEAFDAAPSKWMDGRTGCLLSYFATIQTMDMSLVALDFKDDDAKLKRISNDESEPMHVRFFALVGRHVIQHVCKNFAKGATYLRRGFVLAGEIAEDERKRKIRTQSGTHTVGDMVDDCIVAYKENLRVLERPVAFPFDVDVIAANLGYESELGRNAMSAVISRGFSTGGDKCDGCRKSAAELGMDVLFKCSRCKLGFYCSKACQVQQWKDIHHDGCRKYGEVSIGDWMLIHSLKNRRDLNGKLVRVEGPDQKKRGRWEVKNLESNDIISVASVNLRHMRPLVESPLPLGRDY